MTCKKDRIEAYLARDRSRLPETPTRGRESRRWPRPNKGEGGLRPARPRVRGSRNNESPPSGGRENEPIGRNKDRATMLKGTHGSQAVQCAGWLSPAPGVVNSVRCTGWLSQAPVSLGGRSQTSSCCEMYRVAVASPGFAVRPEPTSSCWGMYRVAVASPGFVRVTQRDRKSVVCHT